LGSSLEAASGKHPSAGQVAALVRVMDPARLDTMKRLLRNMLCGATSTIKPRTLPSS
jgi:hypothetical protein